MSMFGPAADRPVAWCNLCRAVGVDVRFDPDSPRFIAIVEAHTAQAHPEHVEQLRRGEAYEPVEVAP